MLPNDQAIRSGERAERRVSLADISVNHCAADNLSHIRPECHKQSLVSTFTYKAVPMSQPVNAGLNPLQCHGTKGGVLKSGNFRLLPGIRALDGRTNPANIDARPHSSLKLLKNPAFLPI